MSREGNAGRLQVRLEDGMWDWLEGRSIRYGSESADVQARDELTMWRHVLAVELGRIKGMTVRDAVLMSQIQSPPTTAEDHALFDALSRWREQKLPASVDGFAQVGLRVEDD